MLKFYTCRHKSSVIRFRDQQSFNRIIISNVVTNTAQSAMYCVMLLNITIMLVRWQNSAERRYCTHCKNWNLKHYHHTTAARYRMQYHVLAVLYCVVWMSNIFHVMYWITPVIKRVTAKIIQLISFTFGKLIKRRCEYYKQLSEYTNSPRYLILKHTRSTFWIYILKTPCCIPSFGSSILNMWNDLTILLYRFN